MKKIVFVTLVIAIAFMGVTSSYAASPADNHSGHQITITSKIVMSSASLLNTVMTGVVTPVWASTDPFASTSVANAPGILQATATGKLGKAIFFFALLAGILCI